MNEAYYEELEYWIKQLIEVVILETRNNPDVHIDEIAKWQDHKLIEMPRLDGDE